jgi:hypothetical protein
MPKNKRIGDSKSRKVGHKSPRETIYEMGIDFVGPIKPSGRYMLNE